MTRIIIVPFLIPNQVNGKATVAQVLLPGIIFAKRDFASNTPIIAHELKHIDQINTLGLVRYWFRYLRLLRLHGYLNHPMEIEARAAESNPTYRLKARELIERHGLS